MFSQDDDPLCFMYVDNRMTHALNATDDPLYFMYNNWTWYLVNNRSGSCWWPYSINVSKLHNHADDPQYTNTLRVLSICRLMGLETVCSLHWKSRLSVCTATLQQATYFPNRYFRRMVVCFMVHHRQLMYQEQIFVAYGQLWGWGWGRAGQRVDSSFVVQSSTCTCCSEEIFGAMRQCCLLCRVCGGRGLLYSIQRPCKSTGSGTTGEWRRQRWWSHIMV